MKPVTDPSLLEQLEKGPVTDPEVLRQLDEPTIGDKIAKIQSQDDIEEPSTFQYLFNRLKKTAAGVIGAPGDIISAMKPTPEQLRAIANNPRIANPPDVRAATLGRANDLEAAENYRPTIIPTSGDIELSIGFDKNMETNNVLKRYAGGVVEMAGAALPFAPIMKAATLPALVASMIGSGIGLEAGGDTAEGLGFDRPVGEAAGALLGGAVSAVSPNAMRAGIDLAKNRFSPSVQKARVENQVAREVSAQLDDTAMSNLNRSLEVSDEIAKTGAEFSPSLPARTASAGLLAEERSLVQRSPEAINKAVSTILNDEKAVQHFVSAKFPVGKSDAATQVAGLQKQAAQRLDAMRKAVDDKLDDSIRVFQANPSNYENGNRLRDLFFKQKQVYRGTSNQKYQRVYDAAKDAGVTANIDDVVAYADDVLKSEMNAYQQQDIPSVFRQIKNEFIKEPSKAGPTVKTTPAGKQIKIFDTATAAPEPADISFEQLHSLYKRTNSDLASLRGSQAVDKDFRIMLLEGLKTKLTDKIKGFEADGFGEVATKLRGANRFYAEEYVPRFKQGFGSDVAARYSSGEFRTPAEHVTELITKANNTQAAKDFRMLFDETPEAWDALRNGYLDKLHRQGNLIDASGRINQKALDTFLRQHEPTLREFPEIGKDLQRLSLDNSALLARRAQIVAAEKKLAAQDLFKLFQGKDPAEVLTKATGDPNVMRLLARQAGRDPNTAKALNRSIAEHVAAQQDPARFLAENADAIKIGLKPLGDEHFKNLTTAVDAMTINSRNPVSIGSSPFDKGDPIFNKFGATGASWFSQYRSVIQGRSSLAQEGVAFLGRLFNKLRRDHRATALEAVFYDKDTARVLANLAQKPDSPKAQMEWAKQMASLGIRAVVAGED